MVAGTDAPYPGVMLGEGLHRELVAALNEIMRSSSDLMQLEMNLVDLMNRWLSEHIAAEDARVAAHNRDRAAHEAAG